jgi:hypothetical protein
MSETLNTKKRPSTTSSAKERPNNSELKCKSHPKEKVQFRCDTDKIKICAICVPEHSGHVLISLKDGCMKLLKPWSDMRTKFTTIKQKLDNCVSLPEKERNKLQSRYNSLLERC